MNLVPHIFRKDVRHFYPEILVHLALLVMFAWSAPSRWDSHPLASAAQIASVLLRLLLPIAWLVLISRVIHDEALVGDRQFWITRPYRWAALLCEKVLFLLAFLYVPLFCMQVYLLHHAGLALGPAWKDLLLYQAVISMLYVLPFAAIAVVTATFGRHVLFLLGGLVYLVAVTIFTSWLTKHAITPPYADGAIAAVLLVVLAIAVLVMYARRPVFQVRLALLCLPLMLMLLYLCAPTGLLMQHAYAAGASGDALAFDPAVKLQQTGSGRPVLFERDVVLKLPVRFKGRLAGEEVYGRGVQITLRSADGFTWRSPYENAQLWFRSEDPETLDVYVPSKVYERLQSRPVDVQLRVALEPYTFGSAQTGTVPATGFFPSPGRGSCETRSGGEEVQCRFALRHPMPSQAAFEVQDVPCRTSSPRHMLLKRSDGAVGAMTLDFDPVAIQTIPLQKVTETAEGNARTAQEKVIPQYLCPGARASFAPQQSGVSEQLVLQQAALALPQYVQQYGSE